MDTSISKIINRALDGNGLDEQEIAALFKVKDLSEEALVIQYAWRMFGAVVPASHEACLPREPYIGHASVEEAFAEFLKNTRKLLVLDLIL